MPAQRGEVITNGFTLLLLALWVVFYERRSILSMGLRNRRSIARFAAGFGGGLMLFGIALGCR
ncbi:hypothetical protein [Rhodococcus koreensis]